MTGNAGRMHDIVTFGSTVTLRALFNSIIVPLFMVANDTFHSRILVHLMGHPHLIKRVTGFFISTGDVFLGEKCIGLCYTDNIH
jgi:hypothetical protein